MSTSGCCWFVLGAGLAITCGASAQLAADSAQSKPTPNLSDQSNSPLIAIEDPDRRYGVELMLDMNRFDALRDAGGVVLRGVPVDRGVTLDLDLARFEVLAPEAKIEVWSEDGRVEIERPEVVLLRGTVLGDEDSLAFIALSEFGVNGFIETGAQQYIISNGQYGTNDSIVAYNLATLPEGAMNIREFVCGTDTSDFDSKIDAGQGGNTTRDVLCSVIDLAIDTDYEFTNWLFGDSQPAATVYIETLIGATSSIYDRDVNTVFEISYIRLWSDNSDPYFGLSHDYLDVLGTEWTTDSVLVGVPRDLAHVLSPTPGGGGVAWINRICNFFWGYGASTGINGFFPQPLGKSSQNWDIYVVSHELGHNCGASHTHQMDPIIDGCGLGDCTGAENGTIMSYCHQCWPGIFNINLEFHPTIQLSLEGAITGAACVDTAAPPVFAQNPESQIACLGEQIIFLSQVNSPGTILYQWYFDDSPIFGAVASTYTIASMAAVHVGDYYVTANTNCGSATSTIATLLSCAPIPCSPADITTQGAAEGDMGFGVPDELITASDIEYYVNGWFARDIAIADVTTQGPGEGQPGYGVPDGLVTAADIGYFVNYWYVGCPNP